MCPMLYISRVGVVKSPHLRITYGMIHDASYSKRRHLLIIKLLLQQVNGLLPTLVDLHLGGELLLEMLQLLCLLPQGTLQFLLEPLKLSLPPLLEREDERERGGGERRTREGRGRGRRGGGGRMGREGVERDEEGGRGTRREGVRGEWEVKGRERERRGEG